MNGSVLSFEDVDFQQQDHDVADDIDLQLEEETPASPSAHPSNASPKATSSSTSRPSASQRPFLKMENVFATVKDARVHVSKKSAEKAVYYIIEVFATYTPDVSGSFDQSGDIVLPDDDSSPKQETLKWTIYRRFSDFDVLHATLGEQSRLLPTLPSKTWWPDFSPEFIAKRRVELNDYVMKLFSIPYVCNSREMVMFLEVNKHAVIDTSRVPRAFNIVSDRNFGVNAHYYNQKNSFLITACQEVGLIQRLDTQLANLRFWDQGDNAVEPAGSLNLWVHDKNAVDSNNAGAVGKWIPTITIFYEMMVSAVSYDTRRNIVWVGLSDGRVLGYLCTGYSKLSVIADLRLHKDRVASLIYDADSDRLYSIGRDSWLHCLTFTENAPPPGADASTVLAGTDAAPHISISSTNATEGWLTSLTLDTNRKLIYIGTFSGKILVYRLSTASGAAMTVPEDAQRFYRAAEVPTDELHNGSLISSPRAQSSSASHSAGAASRYTRMVALDRTAWQRLCLVHVLTGHDDCVRAVSYCPENACVVSGGFDSKAGLWGPKAGKADDSSSIVNVGWLEKGPKFKIKSVCVCSSAQTIVTGLDNGTLALWDASTGQLSYIIPAHAGDVVSLEWVEETRTLVSGGRDGCVKFWYMKE